MARLTDTQLIILSAASQREDRGVELPANVKGEAAERSSISSSARACWRRFTPIWRRDNESGAIALRVTSAGLAAIDATDEETAAPQDSKSMSGGGCGVAVGKRLGGGDAGGALPVWRCDDHRGAMALRITESGLAAIPCRA